MRSVLMPPIMPISMPAFSASSTAGLTPTDKMTLSHSISPVLVTTLCTCPFPVNSTARSPVMTSMPISSMTFLMMAAASSSKTVGRTCPSCSSKVTLTPLLIMLMQDSTPMLPAPMTTARSPLKLKILSASCMVFSVEIPSLSTPDIFGMIALPPVARSNLSYS